MGRMPPSWCTLPPQFQVLAHQLGQFSPILLLYCRPAKAELSYIEIIVEKHLLHGSVRSLRLKLSSDSSPGPRATFEKIYSCSVFLDFKLHDSFYLGLYTQVKMLVYILLCFICQFCKYLHGFSNFRISCKKKDAQLDHHTVSTITLHSSACTTRNGLRLTRNTH